MQNVKLKTVTGILIFFISLFVYLITLCPTVYVGDCGELTTSVYQLGIAHPPGYPIYCILGKIFCAIPFSNIAYRVNFMSAFFAAASIVLLFLSLLKIQGFQNTILDYFIAGSVSLMFTFSNTFWSQSVFAEVYTLNIFFVALTFYLILSLKNTIGLYVFSLIYGIGLANHNTLMLLGPIYILYIIFHTKTLSLKPRNFIISLSLAFLGMCFYFYLPIRSLANPLADWGNPENFKNILAHVLRQQYGSLSAIERSFALTIKQLIAYLKILNNEFTVLPLILSLIGLAISIVKIIQKKEDAKFTGLITLLFLSTSIGMILLLNFKVTTHEINSVKEFLIPSYFFAAIFIGIAIKYIISVVKSKFSSLPDKGWLGWVAIALCTTVVITPILSNYKINDLSKNYIAYDYGINTLNTLDNSTILFSAGDSATFVLMYLQMVEKLRQDLSIYDDTGVTFKNIYGERYLKMSIQEHQIQMNTIQQQILNANQKSVTEKNGGTIYFILGSNLHNMLGLLAKPIGIVYKVVSKNTQLTDTQNIWQLYKLRGIYDSTSDKDYLTKDLIAQYHIALGENYFDAGDTNNAKLEYKKASQIGKDIDAVQSAIASIFTKKGLIEEAFEGSKLAVERNQWDPDLHNNLATAYLGKGMLDEAIKEYKKALELNPKLSEVYNNLGITYLQKGDYENAKLSLSKACMLSPADAQVYNNLGMTYAKLNNLPLAVSAYKKALSIKPNYVDAHFNLGNIYLRSGENDLALQEYKYAISLAPTKAEIYNNTGVAYGNKKDFDNAIEFYKKAIDVNPKYAEAYNNLAGAYYNKGDFKKAKLFWENTLKLDSTHKAAKEYLIQLGNIRN